MSDRTGIAMPFSTVKIPVSPKQFLQLQDLAARYQNKQISFEEYFCAVQSVDPSVQPGQMNELWVCYE